jgi:GNAT superfamily N-acetyltransferase
MRPTRIRTTTGLDLDVAEATPEDADALHAAFAAVVAADEGYPQSPGRPLSMADFRDYWLDGKSLVVVARTDGEVAGSYCLRPNFPGRGAHIANAGYFVTEGRRRRGIGTVLVEHSLDAARELGFDAMIFNLVFEANPARRLYERLGFEVIGRIPDAVAGRTAIIYWRRI